MASLEIKNFDILFEIDADGKTRYLKADIVLAVSGIPSEGLVEVKLDNYKGSAMGRGVFRREAGITDGDITLGLADLVDGYKLLSEGDGLGMDAYVVSGPTYIVKTATLTLAASHRFEAGKKYQMNKALGLKEATTEEKKSMVQRNYSQQAVAEKLQLGKGGSVILHKDGKVSVLEADAITLTNMGVADAVAPTDAVNLKQLDERFAEIAKKGTVVITDLVSSSNPWAENEIRITPDLGFLRKTAESPDTFVPADGTVLSVAKELTIDAGKIIGKDAETKLFPDHLYIFDADTGKLFDNGAISEGYDERHVTKKMPITFDKDGKATGLDSVPANALVIGAEVIVNEVFDGTPNALKVQLAGDDIVDFATVAIDQIGRYPVLAQARSGSEETPVVTGTVDSGTKGSAILLIEYLMA